MLVRREASGGWAGMCAWSLCRDEDGHVDQQMFAVPERRLHIFLDFAFDVSSGC